jgi:hypothetical protein
MEDRSGIIIEVRWCPAHKGIPGLDFLSTTGVGRRVLPPAEDDAQSEASEWEPQERREREEERRVEAEELGAGGEE